MKTKLFSTLVLVGIMNVAVGFAACENQKKAVTETATTTEQFEPESRFASIDTLVAYMLDQQREIIEKENLVDFYQSVSSAMTSYWYINHKDDGKDNVTETVCHDLTVLADSLSGGSTWDMTQSGEIRGVISRFLSAQNYFDNHQQNPLYQKEMNAWLELENKLLDFYGSLTQVANWGGSIVNVIHGGNISAVADARWQDYSQLVQGGKFASCEMSINDARTELIQEINDAKSLEDDLVDEEDYRNTLNDMRKSGDELIPLLDKWLELRAKLSESEGIPEAHTAHVIEFLAQRIQVLVEG
ncbi:MAG: hypothetical protein IKW97_03355 [Muribaculaceae bacterium]|nr:hypothetical protein [Muribaculaceae bacterium]